MNIWSLEKIWNDAIAQKQKPVKPRDYIWAGEIGKNFYERYLKMTGVEPDKVYDDRVLRKFSAGLWFEDQIGYVLKTIGILEASQESIEIPETEDHLKITGRLDYIAGGQTDWSVAEQRVMEAHFPEFIETTSLALISHFKEFYPSGLEKIVIEVKSVNCLAGDQLVYSDGRLTPIKSLVGGEKILSLSRGFSMVEGIVKNVWKAGKKQTYKITTGTGRTLVCSDGHKFLTPTISWQDDKYINEKNVEWKELKELKVGKKIAVPRQYPEIKEETISPDKALLLGWIIGDGHINKRFGTRLVTETEEEASLVKGIADREFDLDCQVKKYHPSVFSIGITGGVKNRGGRYNRTNKFILWLDDMKFNPSGVNKYVPSVIFDSSNKVIGKFLSGLFQADGYVRKNGSSIEIGYNTISPQLAKDVHHLLTRLGILSHLKAYNHLPSGFRTKSGIIYKIGIRNIDARKFQKSVGFYCHKKKRMSDLMKKWECRDKPRKENIFFDIIKSIEPVGVQETYDLEVSSDSHSYYAGDILVHNSQVFWAKKDYLEEAYPHHVMQLYTYLKATGIKKGIILYISKDDLTIKEQVILLGDERLEKLWNDDIKQMSEYYRKQEKPPRPEDVVFDKRKKLTFQHDKKKIILQGAWVSNWEVAWSNYFTLITGCKDEDQWFSKINPIVLERNALLRHEYKENNKK